MSGSSMFDLHWEHPRLPQEAHVCSPCLAAAHNPVNGFIWRPPTPWWAIKAYLHSVPLKGSEAPERSSVWSDISVQLHSLPCCHVFSYTFFFFFYMGIKPVPPPWSCLTLIHLNYHCYLCLISECTQVWLFIATVSVHNNTAQWASYIRMKDDQTKARVIPTCWISWDRVSISQPRLGARLRSSVKDEGWGNEMI